MSPGCSSLKVDGYGGGGTAKRFFGSACTVRIRGVARLSHRHWPRQGIMVLWLAKVCSLTSCTWEMRVMGRLQPGESMSIVGESGGYQ